MKEAIKKAIEGGWSKTAMPTLHAPGYPDAFAYPLLDPLFWKCLFKKYVVGRPFKISERTEPQWKTEWHRFIDHLAEGKDAEEFFINLLNQNK